MANSETVIIGNLNNKPIQVEKSLWESFQEELKNEDSNNINKNILIIIEDIINTYLTNNSFAWKNFKKLLGIRNIEYLINFLLTNRQNINSVEAATELKILLTNIYVMFSMARPEIYDFLKEVPILESSNYVQKAIQGAIIGIDTTEASAMLCKELEKFLTRENEFGGFLIFERIKNDFNYYQRTLNDFYNLENFGPNYENLFYSKIHHLIAYNLNINALSNLVYHGRNKSIYDNSNDTQDTENNFLAFLNLLFDKLRFFQKEHLYIIQYVLSNRFFLYRAKGKDDVYDLINILSNMPHLSEEKQEFITDFFDSCRIVDKKMNPTYDIFMFYLRLANTASAKELWLIYDCYFNNPENSKCSFANIRYIIYEVACDFPEICDLEMIIIKSVKEYSGNGELYGIDFLNIIFKNIAEQCDISSSRFTVFKLQIKDKLSDFYYQIRLDFIKECYDISSKNGNLMEFLNSETPYQRVLKKPYEEEKNS